MSLAKIPVEKLLRIPATFSKELSSLLRLLMMNLITDVRIGNICENHLRQVWKQNWHLLRARVDLCDFLFVDQTVEFLTRKTFDSSEKFLFFLCCKQIKMHQNKKQSCCLGILLVLRGVHISFSKIHLKPKYLQSFTLRTRNYWPHFYSWFAKYVSWIFGGGKQLKLSIVRL